MAGRQYDTVSPLPRHCQKDHKHSNDLYQPLRLESKEIRVLDLYPGQRDDPICCELRTVSLTTNPPPKYETYKTRHF